jgi:hypothetical protein
VVVTAANVFLAAALVAAVAAPLALAAAGPRVSAAAGFPISASANTAPAMRAAIQAGIRRYSGATRARVTSIRRAGRYWNATSTAPAPYRVLLCTRTYCQATAPAQAPTIRVEVKR